MLQKTFHIAPPNLWICALHCCCKCINTSISARAPRISIYLVYHFVHVGRKIVVVIIGVALFPSPLSLRDSFSISSLYSGSFDNFCLNFVVPAGEPGSRRTMCSMDSLVFDDWIGFLYCCESSMCLPSGVRPKCSGSF